MSVTSGLVGIDFAHALQQFLGVRLLDFWRAGSFTTARRKELVAELAPLRERAIDDHPWKEWGGADDTSQRMPGATSRWNRGKDLSWEPLRPERVCEVAYDHLQGDRFRHATHFLRWRPDKEPRSCRYDQLEETPAFELGRIFGATSGGPA